MEKLSLYVWSVLITAWLLLISLPVLAGMPLIVPALNLAICWKLYLNRQSAGNLLDYLIKILRDYTPEFVRNKKEFFSMISSSQNQSQLGYYLTGLLEGNGYIFTPKCIRDKKNRLIYPSLQIAFHSKDIPLAFIIQNKLNSGSLSKKKNNRAYIQTITKKDDLIKFIHLINGKFRTEKFKQFENLINWVNINYNVNISKLPLDLSCLSSNSWLSGFIDADGCFYLRSTEKNKYPAKIECKFEIEQNKINTEILNKLAYFLLTNIKFTVKDKIRVRTTSLKGNKILIEYLNKFPLFSSKYLDYLDWVEGIKIIEKKEHKNDIGKEKIIHQKSSMNNNRTFFIWDHLNKFYSINE